MAMFLGGLEDTPYTGWTLSGLVAAGPRLFLAGTADQCNSTSGYTLNSGAFPTVDTGRFRFTAAGNMLTTTTVSGDFDVRADVAVTTNANNRWVRLIASFGSNNFSVAVNSSGPVVELLRTGAVVAASAGTSTTTFRTATVRLTRTGNLFTAYYRRRLLDSSWVTVGSDTQSYATSGTIGLISAQTSGIYYVDNLRQCIPGVTSGTATSPVLDTVDGFRGVGWEVLFPGTGTVLVEYRVGATSGACSAASYTTATAWADVTPSDANRFVQVRLTISGGSTSAASPEVGPILVNGSLDYATADQLFRRMAAAAVRSLDASDLPSINETASTAYSYGGRMLLGVGRWLAAGNGPTCGSEGGTFALAQKALDTARKTATDFVGNADQLRVEAANFVTPGLYTGRATLFGLMTSPQKATLSGQLIGCIGSTGGGNKSSFVMTNQAYLTALEAYDPGSWGTYNDAALDTYYTALVGSGSYAGDGAYNDNSVAAPHIDSYTPVVAYHLASVAEVRPTYRPTDIVPWVKAQARNLGRITDPDGAGWAMGRSYHAATRLQNPQTLLQADRAVGGSRAAARERFAAAIWASLRRAYVFGWDFVSNTPALDGNTGSVEGYVPYAVIHCMATGIVGECAYEPGMFADAPEREPRSAAWAWPGGGVAQAGTGGATDPYLWSHAKASDTATTDNYAAKYGSTRVLSSRHAQNTGGDANRQVSPQGLGFVVRKSDLSANNLCHLPGGTSGTAAMLGCGAVSRRSGTMVQTSATVNFTATGPDATEVVYLHGRHAVVVAKVAAGAATLSAARCVAPTIPLASGGTLANASTNTSGSTWAYAESPTEALSAFVRGVTSNLDAPASGTDFVAEASQINRYNYGGKAPSVSISGTPTGDVYLCADIAVAWGALTPATEAGWLTNYSQTGDVVTFTADSLGTPANVYIGITAQNLSGQAVGNYAITGGSVKSFSGTASAADKFGGDGVTLITFSSANLVALAAAGNVAAEKVSGTLTRVWWDGGANLTVYSAALPAGFGKVYVYDWDGTRVDITSSCTVTSGTSVVVPTSAVSGYDFGLVTLDIEKGTGLLAARRRFM